MMNKMMKKLAKGTAIATAAACMMSITPVQTFASDELVTMESVEDCIDTEDMMDEEDLDACDMMDEDADVDSEEDDLFDGDQEDTDVNEDAADDTSDEEEAVMEATHVVLDTPYFYTLKSVYLTARPIIGQNEDGTPILGDKVDFIRDTNVVRNKEVTIPAGYMDFEFGYDILWGTDWPFRGQIQYDTCKDIRIELGGTCRMSTMRVMVDGREVIKR